MELTPKELSEARQRLQSAFNQQLVMRGSSASKDEVDYLLQQINLARVEIQRLAELNKETWDRNLERKALQKMRQATFNECITVLSNLI